jgi:hypothetical protein
VFAVDARLLAVAPGTQRLLVFVTLLVMAWLWLPYVPRAYVDLGRVPLLHLTQQSDGYGTDTVADMYEAKVVLNDPADMYTKREVAQTPLEAHAWSKDASSPYLPAALLATGALYRIGEWTGLEFYGVVLALACLFIGLSAFYFLQTRWYLFPAMYLSGRYFGYRFVFVQDGTYLVMLLVAMAALLAARRRSPLAHPLMAIAVTVKMLPLYYATNMPQMTRRMAALFVAIVVAGVVAPYFVWENYLYIFRFQNAVKGSAVETVGAVVVAVPFAALLWYVESRRDFDLEDRVGWGLVPLAMLLAFKMNVARHLLIALLVPDKRGLRNVAAAVGMALPSLLPHLIHFNSALSISTAVLFLGLTYHLDAIGWDVVLDDFRDPLRTTRMLLARRRQQDSLSKAARIA